MKRRHRPGAGLMVLVSVAAMVVVTSPPSVAATTIQSFSASMLAESRLCFRAEQKTSSNTPGSKSYEASIAAHVVDAGRAEEMLSETQQHTTVSQSPGQITIQSRGISGVDGSPQPSQACGNVPKGITRNGSSFEFVGPFTYTFQGSIKTKGTTETSTVSNRPCGQFQFHTRNSNDVVTDAFSRSACPAEGSPAQTSFQRLGTAERASLSIGANIDAQVNLNTGGTLKSQVMWSFTLTIVPDDCATTSDTFTATDTCGGLSGTVTDGHGAPMVGVPVQLLDQSETPVGSAAKTNAVGRYTLPPDPNVPPDDYFLSVKLVDADTDPPGLRTHYQNDPEPVEVKRPIDANDFSGASPVDIDISQANILSGLPPADADRIDDVAVIHRRSKQYVDFLKSTFALAANALGPFRVRTFVTGGCGACYQDGTVSMALSESLFNSRSAPNTQAPENVEWHEITHHFANIEGIADITDNPNCRTGSDTNHGGWDNHSTCDSLAEGFAAFLPTFASHVIDAAIDDTYSIFGSLEWGHRKAWVPGQEDIAVAAVLWDLADAANPADQAISKVLPADPNLPPIPFTYRDEVAIGFETVSLIVRQRKPQTVKDLYDALVNEASVPSPAKAPTVDLDGDSFGDVSPLDVAFLMHGFHVVAPTDPDYFYRLGTPVARSDHVPNTAIPGALLERNATPHNPASSVLLRNDSSEPRTVTLTVSDGFSEAIYEITLQPGEEFEQLMDLPPFVSRRIEPDDPLPACGPDNDALLSITISAPGVAPLETDSCQFAHAVEDSNGETALTYAVTPPDGTIKGLGDGVYNSNGSGQTSLVKVKRGKTAVFPITAQNDGLASDTLTVTGCRSSRGFKVSYFDEGTNVTSQVTGAGLSTGALAPGAFEALTLKIKAGKTGPKNKSCLVTATSENSRSLRDAVLAKVKAKG